MRKGFVYVMRNGHTNKFKIGRTFGDPNKRRAQLQTGNPDELFLITYWESNDPKKLEDALHERFKVNRIRSFDPRSEWFYLNHANQVKLWQTAAGYRSRETK